MLFTLLVCLSGLVLFFGFGSGFVARSRSRSSRPLKSSLVLGLVALLAPLALPVAADHHDEGSWATFRGAEGTGQVVGGLPEGDGPLGLELRWKRSVGSGYAGVSVMDGKLLTAMADGASDFLVALDANSGEELWRLELGPTYVGHDGSHDGPVATPGIADGRVFMLGAFGNLVAADLATGEKLWSKHLTEELGREAPFYGFGSSPAVSDGAVILQVGGEEHAVAAFDAATGEMKWQALAGAGDLGSQSPIVAELGGRHQALVLGTNKLAGLDPMDGSVLWQMELDGSSDAMGTWTQSPMPIGEDRIFVKLKDNESQVVQVTKGEEGWKAETLTTSKGLVRSYSPPSLGNENLFGYTARFLSALDPQSGELLWRSRHPGDGFLVNVDEQLAVLTKTGSLHLGPASAEGWDESVSLELFEDLAWTPPSWADGALYLRSLGEVARVDLVRRDRTRFAATQMELPSALAPLAEALTGAEDKKAAVDQFLEGRTLPLVEGEQVVFAWRGPAKDVAIGGDMIGMRREEPMSRLEGTDLWWWSTELDRRARISYLFFVDYEPAVDSTHSRTMTSTILGPDMNWNRGESLKMSWFAMPEWPGSIEPAGEAPSTTGRMEVVEMTVQPPTPEEGEAPEPVPVKLHVWLPPGYDEGAERYPVVYVHHPMALAQGGWKETLDREVGKSFAPLIAVFPEPPRVRGFGALFAEQVVPEVDDRYRTQADRAARANVGMGWQGFAAAMITFSQPETFGKVGVQSLFMLEGQQSQFEGVISEMSAEEAPMDVYLEWGRWDLISPHEEMNFRASSKTGWELLSEKGWRPVGGEVWDSTDFASWRNRTGVVLGALFPRPGSGERLEGWQATN